MSYYIKRISVLKQIGTGFSMNGKALSGLAKIEKTGLNQTAIISLINAAPVTEGDYFAILCGSDKKFSFLNLGKSPVSFSSPLPFLIEIEEGFACLICFVNQNKATNIAFGTSGLVDNGVDEMRQALLKNTDILQTVKTETPVEKLETNYNAEINIDNQKSKIEIPEIENTKIKDYQDEIVATDNYYLYNDVDIDNLSIKGRENESKFIQDDNAYNSNQKIDAKETFAEPTANHENILNLFKDPSTSDFDNVVKGNYFDKVKTELDSIFTEHPKEEALEKNIPCSKWAKIFYSNEKYYTVGLIYDEKRPAYICYGVPGKYSKEPPSELKGFCSYLPLSIFDMQGDGYWMMYQNAESGECVQIDFI